MKINLFVGNFLGGHRTDRIVLTEELENLGHEVRWALDASNISHADLNIHFEAVYVPYLKTAEKNWLLTNPEWFYQPIECFDLIDLILCKTKEAERNFSHLGFPTFYLGFTSPDCFMPEIEKDFNRLFHYQGGTSQRGTFWLERTWSGDIHHQLPPLTIFRKDKVANGIDYERGSLKVVTGHLDDEEYKEIQNRSGIHLSPSLTEGFGHSMNEAMSACCIVITIDAPPMNELITDPECLIPIKNPHMPIKIYNAARLFHYDPRDIVKVVKKLTSWPREKLIEMGQKNRQTYLSNREAFRERLKKLLESI